MHVSILGLLLKLPRRGPRQQAKNYVHRNDGRHGSDLNLPGHVLPLTLQHVTYWLSVWSDVE